MKKALWSILLVMALVSAGCVGDDGGDDEDVDPSGVDGTDTSGELPGNDDGRITTPGPGGGESGNQSHEHLPHVHDYWDGRTRVLLADERVELQPWFTFYSLFMEQEAAIGGTWWELPQGQIIYEGTGKVEITTTWDAPTVTGMSFAYRHANTRDLSEWQPLVNGETFTIETTPDMTDLAHSGSSRWTFFFRADGQGQAALGDFHLTMEIVKVHNIMELPGHGDAWGGKEALTLMDEETTSQSNAFYTQIVNCVSGDCDGNEGFLLPDGNTVPIGADILEVVITPQGESSDTSSVYLSAYDARGEWIRGEDLPSDQAGSFRFYIPVEPGAADSPYAEQSLWEFYVYFRADAAGMGVNCGGCTDREMQFHATVKAWKDWDMPEGEDEEDDDGSF